MGFIDDMLGVIPNVATGAANLAIQRHFNQLDKEDEKQWWYEQQKYLEEHNSPAYRSMQMRKAGLNPYTEVSSTPLGNVDSSLPRMSASDTFDVNAIQNSLLMQAQKDNLKSQTKKNLSEAGLTDAKTLTETEWRSNLIQQTLNLQQEFALGLITEDERKLKFQELKDAYDSGYNSYLIEMDLAKSTQALNDSLVKYNDAKTERERQETLNALVVNAAMTFQLELDRHFQPLIQKAILDGKSINNSFDAEKLKEFLETQDVRVSLNNVQQAFAKLAADEATRQDALNRITNETERIIAEQILDKAKNGEGFDYWLLNLIQKDPGAILNSLTNITNSFAPNVNYNTSSSRVIRQTQK